MPPQAAAAAHGGIGRLAGDWSRSHGDPSSCQTVFVETSVSKRAAYQAVSDPPRLLITPGCAPGRTRSLVDRMDASVARPRTRNVYTRTISKRTRRVNIEVRAVSKYASRMRAPD